jgi:hypothetical protein
LMIQCGSAIYRPPTINVYASPGQRPSIPSLSSLLNGIPNDATALPFLSAKMPPIRKGSHLLNDTSGWTDLPGGVAFQRQYAVESVPTRSTCRGSYLSYDRHLPNAEISFTGTVSASNGDASEKG